VSPGFGPTVAALIVGLRGRQPLICGFMVTSATTWTQSNVCSAGC
jgi:hypothetical protein